MPSIFFESLWLPWIHLTAKFLSNVLILRYEAGTILKKMCLKELALGEVLQILHLVINVKKWMTPNQSGWKPVNISIRETSPGP